MVEDKKFQLVKVYWLDAADNTQKDIASILQSETRKWGVERETCPMWLIKSDEHGIVLGRDLCEDSDVDITFIPRGMVLDVKKVHMTGTTRVKLW